MKKIVAMSIAAAAMTLASSGAQALTLTLSQAPSLTFSGNPTGVIHYNSTTAAGGGTLPIGPQTLVGTLGSSAVSLFAYCIDLAQYSAQDTFQVVSLQDYLTSVRPSDAAAVYTKYAKLLSANPAPATAQAGGAMQAAIWELRYETTGNPLNLFAGSTYITGLGNNTAAFDPNGLLNSGSTYINPLLQIWVAKSAGSQDLLFTSLAPVPEPATWGMMIAGLAVVGYAMRSKNRTSQISFA